MKKIIFTLLVLLLPLSTHAARLYFEPSTINAAPGEIVEVGVYLDPQGDEVNALEGEIVWPDVGLDLVSVRERDSLATIWLREPGLQPGENGGEALTFSGVIPGGFGGFLSPFYTGARPGQLFRLQVTSHLAGTVTLGWSAARVLLNDGAGTATTTWTANLALRTAPGLDNSAPARPLPLDTEPPEEFLPEIGREESLFSGRWFLVFHTRDTLSGIAKYQVAEHQLESVNGAEWSDARSPYRLRDQRLTSYVSVRALDHAGNERVVTLPPTHSPADYAYGSTYLWLIILLCFVALSYFFYSYSSRRP